MGILSSLVLVLLQGLQVMLLMMIVACQSYSSASVVGIQRKGFVSMPFNQSFYNIQSPYNLPQTKRYSFLNGVHKCWVYSNDLPLSRTSQTKPRTEIAIKGYVYNSGVWEFQGYGYVPSGTSGVSIMQILGSWPPRATSLMLMVYDGSLCYYNESQVVLRNVYDKWFKLNVIDDFDTGKIKVYINDELKLEVQGRGGKNHIFKCGVYAQLNDSRLMESRWRDIRIFKKV